MSYSNNHCLLLPMFILPTTEITIASLPYSSLSIRNSVINQDINFSFWQRQSPAVSTTASRNIYILKKKSPLLKLNNTVSKHKCPSITYTLLCFNRQKVYVCESNSRMQESLLWIAYYIKMFRLHWALSLYVKEKDFSMCIPGTMPTDMVLGSWETAY